jgi:hypothetical protein
MSLCRQRGHRLIGIAALIGILLISGCSGISPDGKLRNNREEGPESGIFSGSSGEFVLVAPTSKDTDKKVEDEQAEKSQQ